MHANKQQQQQQQRPNGSPLQEVIQTLHEFTPAYRTSLFCVYESPKKIVKIGDDNTIDISPHYQKAAAPYVSQLVLFDKGSQDIPSRFHYLTSTSVTKTMLVYNLRADEMRLCDIDTQNWNLDTRISCIKVIMQMVLRLYNLGIFFTRQLTPGTISLYKNSNQEIKACCNETEILSSDPKYASNNNCIKLISYYLNVHDTEKYNKEDVPVHFRHFPRQQFDVVPGVYNVPQFDPWNPSAFVEMSPVKFNYTKKPIILFAQIMKTNAGAYIRVCDVIALPIITTGLKNTLHLLNAGYVIEVAPVDPKIIANAKLALELMPANLPPCYYVTEEIATLDNARNAFENFTSRSFEERMRTPTEFTFNRPASAVMFSLQRRDKTSMTLAHFLCTHPQCDATAIIRKVMVLWCKLACVGIVLGTNTTLEDIYIHELPHPSTQLAEKEIVVFTDGTTQLTKLSIDCECNFDVFIKLSNQHMEEWADLKMSVKSHHSLVCVVPFIVFYAKLFQLESGFCHGIQCNKFDKENLAWLIDQNALNEYFKNGSWGLYEDQHLLDIIFGLAITLVECFNNNEPSNAKIIACHNSN